MTIAQQRPTLTQRALKILVWALEILIRPIPAPRQLSPTPAAPPSLTPAEREAIAVAEATLAAIEVPRLAPIITPAPAHLDTSKWQPTAPYVTAEPVLPDLQDTSQLSYKTQDNPQDNHAELELSDRARLVEAALDEAWGNGLKTYPVLIKFVELKTGKGCSRRTIAAWKKSRKLDQADA